MTEPAQTPPGAVINLAEQADGSSRIDLHDPRQRAAVEGALAELPGLQAVRIVAGYDRAVDEVHVVATPERPPKVVVRDVQSLLMARFNVPTDHRVISVVQVGSELGRETLHRAVLNQVATTQHNLSARVTVTLSEDDADFSATEDGPASGPGRLRATARAALAAARPMLAVDRMTEIEGAVVEEILGQRLAIVFVHVHAQSGDYTLSGCALVHGDELDAVARAVLDAVNREMRAD